MTEYKAGTVAEIGWDMTSGRERAIFDGDRWGTESGCTVHQDNVTVVRPLLVLDPEAAPVGEIRRGDAEGLRKYADVVDRKTCYVAADLLRHIADQIEAQTKPPRIPEPGLWGVVTASHHKATEGWIRTPRGWSNGHSVHPWKSLEDPILVRPGVND